VEWIDHKYLQLKLNTANYTFLFEDALYRDAWLSSLKVAAISTVLCLLLGYPMAYAIARADTTWRNTLLLLVILPFWTSFLLRVYAWIGLLSNTGVINNTLIALGIIDEPIVMLQTNSAMYIGIVYSYLPFMILPLYSNLEKHSHAARGGRRPWLPAVPRFPQHHVAAVQAGRHRRLDAGVHPGGRRVRHSAPARRHQFADDRPRAVGRVLPQP
jgi:putrescine transport system permease protein